MDCERALILISAALDGELTREEQAELEEHLAACPECRALSDDFGVLSVALSDMEAEPPDDLIGRVDATLDQEAQPVTARPRSRWKMWGSLAAMLALVICLGGIYVWSGQLNGTAGAGADSAAPAQSVENSAGAASSDSDLEKESVPSAEAEAMPKESFASDSEGESQVEIALSDAGETESTGDAPADSTSDAPTSNDAAGGTDSTTEQNDPAATYQSPQDETPAPAADDIPETGEMLVAPPPPPPEADEMEDARADDSQTESITSLQALELAFAAAGGLEAYPNAELKSEDPPRYYLSASQTEDTQTTLLLEYSGLSANGEYYIIRQYEYIVQDGPNGWAHAATVNHYAVSLDGTGVLVEYDEDGSSSTTQAYREAVGG